MSVFLCFPLLYRLCDHYVRGYASCQNEDLVIFQSRGDQGPSYVVVPVYEDSCFIWLYINYQLDALIIIYS
jgi:hypothetical protein